MDLSFSLIFNILAILLMVYCLWLVLSFRKNVVGGVIGKKWNILTALVAMFAVGYAAMPFLNDIPPEILRTIISAVFFFGAIYVLITIQLIKNIIRVLTK